MSKLNILWTTDNKDTVTHMLGMYAINAKAHGWWDEINIIIWGASARLVAEDVEIQALVSEMLKNQVSVEACKGCSDSFGVTQALKDLGVDVRYMGTALTEYLNSEDKLLTL